SSELWSSRINPTTAGMGRGQVSPLHSCRTFLGAGVGVVCGVAVAVLAGGGVEGDDCVPVVALPQAAADTNDSVMSAAITRILIMRRSAESPPARTARVCRTTRPDGRWRCRSVCRAGAHKAAAAAFCHVVAELCTPLCCQAR